MTNVNDDDLRDRQLQFQIEDDDEFQPIVLSESHQELMGKNGF
jgi:hypothetical protein